MLHNCCFESNEKKIINGDVIFTFVLQARFCAKFRRENDTEARGGRVHTCRACAGRISF